MASPTELTSSSHLTTLISAHPLTIIDFHAAWCGPCHAIAPFYASLAQKHSSPNRIIFTKCDVDAQSSIARTYSVTAMPTFVILHQEKEVARIRGADRSALGREVEKWVNEVGGAKRTGFTGSGQVLGSVDPKKPTPSGSGSGSGAGRPKYIRGGEARTSVPFDVKFGQWVDWLIMIVVLYFVSLLSLDPWGACEGVGPQGGGGRWGTVTRGFFGGGGGGGGPGGPGGRPGGGKLGGMDTIPGAGRTVSGVNTGSCCG